MHVHGAFSDMKDIYRSDSLRNMLSDRPIDNVKIFYEYAHLYSTALTAYSGDTKDFMATQAQNSNEALVKLVDAYNNNPEVKADVDSWKNDNNEAVRKLYESLMIKIENPDIEYRDISPIDRWDKINGELYIVGLAPTNDTHIIKRIIENKNLDKIIYYYFLDGDKELFTSLMLDHNIEFRDVGSFWKSFDA